MPDPQAYGRRGDGALQGICTTPDRVASDGVEGESESVCDGEIASGPWSAFKDIGPPEKSTYGAQSTMLVKVVGTKTTTVIFMGDIWRPTTQWDSRYLWMPLEIGDGKVRLPEPRHWTLDVVTGEAVINARCRR